MTRTIEFWYEFASTYSYPAAMRADRAAAEHGVQVVWRPFLLGVIFRDMGWTTSPFNEHPAKGAYMWRDMARICAKQGLGFGQPSSFPQNGLNAARVAMALPDDARGTFSRAVYEGQFAQGRDISDSQLLMDAVAQIGQDASAIWDTAMSDANKAALRDQTAQAQTLGIFGAPTWRTPDGELFWGNDRLQDALDWMDTAPA